MSANARAAGRDFAKRLLYVNSRVATCYDKPNAELMVRALNALDADYIDEAEVAWHKNAAKEPSRTR